mmetsp:Transcript_8248/g.24375  ORF Transcript_8248/g.24375 Transcript_8248/m.24375 type:complete len:324 (+) Transcript_8248:509-1480(+)
MHARDLKDRCLQDEPCQDRCTRHQCHCVGGIGHAGGGRRRRQRRRQGRRVAVKQGNRTEDRWFHFVFRFDRRLVSDQLQLQIQIRVQFVENIGGHRCLHLLVSGLHLHLHLNLQFRSCSCSRSRCCRGLLGDGKHLPDRVAKLGSVGVHGIVAVEFPRIVAGRIRPEIKDNVPLGGSQSRPPRCPALVGARRKPPAKVRIEGRVFALSDGEQKDAFAFGLGETLVRAGHGGNHANAPASVLVAEINGRHLVARGVSRFQDRGTDDLSRIRAERAMVLAGLLERGCDDALGAGRTRRRQRSGEEWGHGRSQQGSEDAFADLHWR